jgi:hypothetical protein
MRKRLARSRCRQRSRSMPTLLFINIAITVPDDVWIFKDACRRFERNAMFPTVDAVLVLVPRKNHQYIQNRITLPFCVFRPLRANAITFASMSRGQ